MMYSVRQLFVISWAVSTAWTALGVSAAEPVVRSARRPDAPRILPLDHASGGPSLQTPDASRPANLPPRRAAVTPLASPPIELVAPNATPPGARQSRVAGNSRSTSGASSADRAPAIAPPPARSADSVALSPQMEALKKKVRMALAMHYRRPVTTRDRNPWEVMHWIIAYGVQAELRRGAPNGEPVNAIGWMAFNYPCHGQTILQMNDGRVAAQKGVGVQGHYGQFLAILAQSRLVRDYPLRVDGRDFTLEDLIESEKLSCESGMELTFKLISLVHYLDTDAVWKNHRDEQWSIERLVREEIASPIRGAACGGTHRLMGLSYAFIQRQLRNEPVDGQFLRAQKYIQDYHKYAFGLQNSDGSFSTQWFVRREARADLERRLQTTGHILEWMVYSASDEMLDDPRLIKAVNYLSSILINYRTREWEIGHLGHGLHALSLYDERRFKPQTEPLAKRSAAAAEHAMPTGGIAHVYLAAPEEPDMPAISASDAVRAGDDEAPAGERAPIRIRFEE